MRRRRKTAWTLAQLYGKCPSALAIWDVLETLGAIRGSGIVTPTRTQLAELTGIHRLPTISRGLTVLEEAGWIDRAHVPIYRGNRQTATCLRIVLRRRERSALRTKAGAVENAQRSKGREHSALRDFPSERGGSRPRPLDGAEDTANTLPEHPSVRIERERLAQIRVERELREQQKCAN